MTAPTPACPRCEVLESTAGEVAQHLLLFQRPGFGSLQPHGGSHSPVTPVPGDPPPFWFPGTPSRMWCTYMHANTHTTTTKKSKSKSPQFLQQYPLLRLFPRASQVGRCVSGPGGNSCGERDQTWLARLLASSPEASWLCGSCFHVPQFPHLSVQGLGR